MIGEAFKAIYGFGKEIDKRCGNCQWFSTRKNYCIHYSVPRQPGDGPMVVRSVFNMRKCEEQDSYCNWRYDGKE